MVLPQNQKQRKKTQETEKSALRKREHGIVAIRNWMVINWLKLNDDKTEFIVLGWSPNLSKVKTYSITVGEHQIQGSHQVCNIRAIFYANAKMEGQVTKTCQTAWFHLYTINKISQYITKEQKQTTIHACVTPRLDQNNIAFLVSCHRHKWTSYNSSSLPMIPLICLYHGLIVIMHCQKVCCTLKYLCGIWFRENSSFAKFRKNVK